MADLPGGPAPDGGGGALSKKLWGLPTWGWIAIAAAVGVGGFIWLQSRNKNAATTPDPNAETTDSGASVGAVQDENASLAEQIRDLQGQLSTSTGDDTSTTSTTLTAPTGLHATAVTGVVIVLMWNGVAGARGYDIQWTDGQNHVGNDTSLLPGYTMARLPRSEKYMIKVRAKHDLPGVGGGSTDGPWSNTIQVTTHKV